MIRLIDAQRTFGTGPSAVHALHPTQLHVEAGEFITIVGASGSGKSTMLNLMGLLDHPTGGSVELDGAPVEELGDNARTRLRRDKIGFVFQFFNLLPTMNALENVTLPTKLAGRPRKESSERARSLLQSVGLDKRVGHRPDQLSGGEMQRVAIARALVMDPPILLADEPTGNLDSETGREIMELLRGATTERRTVVIVTHDPKVAEQGERTIRMADGRVVDA